MKPHLENRALLIRLPSDIKIVLEKYKPRQEEDITEPSSKTRKQCRSCGRSKNTVTAITCTICTVHVCKEYSTTVIKCKKWVHFKTDKS